MNPVRYTESEWRGGLKRLDFEFNGRSAVLIVPDTPAEGRPFMIKTEYFDAFAATEAELVRRGWHLAYIQNETRWGLVSDQDMRADFCRFLQEEFGLAEKCVPVGMSCGGLHAVCFAARHPELVSALYLDAPVMNFLSCPLGLGRSFYREGSWSEVEKTYGIDKYSVLAFRDHPIDRVQPLIDHRIPVLMIYGDADDMVPYEENGALLEAKYRAAGIEFEAHCKPGCGHHPHGLEDNTPILNFIQRHAK